MKMQKTGDKNVMPYVKPGLYKLVMTLCFALIISMFLFACGGGTKDAAHEDSTIVNSKEVVPVNTDSLQRDSALTVPADSTLPNK
ncbi:hypothetical protein KTO58_09720 [Chitinophaga pendula]|uniref:hypothetical protein n=1 Tax=Chitinophaga TaxID=79328 RepID=UPI000BAEA411|nr:MULTISPECIES: hypothetical protein [Chitinophaga]ASZ12930.1 hypothetical protein CK934_19185 [Chitinophaga sp. MD30]UCJ09442.1 hypothetical protein KTO58_09720 [Chitinophaga pendula]